VRQPDADYLEEAAAAERMNDLLGGVPTGCCVRCEQPVELGDYCSPCSAVAAANEKAYVKAVRARRAIRYSPVKPSGRVC
jgi:hypothetical protein